MTGVEPGRTLRVRVDGEVVTVDEGATLLDVCDAAGRYVPRLCHYPGLACCGEGAAPDGADGATECGLCAIRVADGQIVLACKTPARPDTMVCTDDEGLRRLRLGWLESILARHPHVCLSCPDRDGCNREGCSYGNPSEARCCDELGRCELGKLVEWLDPTLEVPRRAVTAERTATTEGRIRREPGLCVGCARCVRFCEAASEAGGALEMSSDGKTARPKSETLRASGCTFCGLCILVCPTGALTSPGEAGARWLASRREKNGLRAGLPPPETRHVFGLDNLSTVPPQAGVFRLVDADGQLVLIRGVADLRRGLAEALDDPTCVTAVFFQTELHPLYTQRESELLARHAKERGCLPPANDLGDDLFGDD